MPNESFYCLAISCIVGGVWLAGILIRGIKQRQNSHRIQQGIAEYCEAAVRAKRELSSRKANCL